MMAKNSKRTETRKPGHRERLRESFLAGEEGARSDESLLELLLTFAIGRKDVRPLAEELIKVFGSLSQVISASASELSKVKGIGQSSIALLKVVDCIHSGTVSMKTNQATSPIEEGNHDQLELFETLPDKSIQKAPEVMRPTGKAAQAPKITTAHEMGDEISTEEQIRRQSKKERSTVRKNHRKLQVSRSHLLEFNHFSRLLSFLYENKDAKRISRQLLIENTGLPDGQVASMVSIGASMGIIHVGSQILTPIGLTIAEHDLFLENQGTLEWCHYKGAGSKENLIWFDIFNHLLVNESAMTQEGWQQYFRNKLKGQYSDKTIKDHIPKEVRFVIDAYLERNFKKLELLHRLPDDRLYRRRYTRFSPLVLSAMIYDFCAAKDAHLFQVGEMAATPGSPAVAFGLDVASFRQQVEGLHDRGWLRYETTHNLDQIRLKPGLSALSFLSAHFEDREPREDSKQSPGGIFQ